MEAIQTDNNDLADAVREIDGLVTQLCQEHDDSKCDQLTDRLLDISQSVLGLDTRLAHNQAAEIQLQNCAFSLWNVAVARKTGESLHQELNAKVRHIACNLASSIPSSRESFVMLKKQITMAGRTGRAWLDCQKPTMADQSLSLALDGLEKMKTMLESSPGGSSDEWHEAQQHQCIEVEREAFKIYATKGESLVMQDEHEVGLHWIQKAKALLPQMPKESSYLAMLCYNFGCDTLDKKYYKATIAWLRESLELGKGEHPIEPEFQARTLRLLASTYLDWDPEQYSQKALNAVGLANAEHSHPSGLHLKIKILLRTNGSDVRIRGALDDLIGHAHLSVNLAVHTIRMLAEHDKLDICLNSCQKMEHRFSSDTDIGKLYIQHLELLLSNKMTSEAKALLEECIRGHSSVFDIDVNTQRHLHTVLWDKAASDYDVGDNAEALAWYSYSLTLLKQADSNHESLAKLQRNRASCFLNLQQPDQALEAVKEAEKLDPISPFTQYILYKVALWKADGDGATQAIQRLSDCSKEAKQDDGSDYKETVLSLICLAAQMALEKDNRTIAVKALEKLVQHSEDQQQILTSLRCLTRLQLTSADGKENTTEASAVLSYLRTAYDTLHSHAETVMDDTDIAWTEEASWFMKISWNMALESSENSTLTHEFFTFCSKFSHLLPPEENNAAHQKTCLFMAAAAALQMAREQLNREDKLASFKQCLDHIKVCRSISQELQTEQGSDSKEMASVLLTLYEFEALANLGVVSELERILEEVVSNPDTEIKTLETMAALTMQPPFLPSSICKKVLQVIIQKYLQQPEGVDLTKCSKALYSMIEICLKDGKVSYDTASRQEAWGHFTTAFNLIEKSDKGITEYPEMQILWLLTRAWNTGIHLLSGGQMTDAEKWCGLGMRFMNHLTSLKSNYEDKMKNIYAEVLDKIERNKLKGVEEEE
ncbi:testis-expressed protein 11-like [Patiria miniata]|uniref:Protein ZIP4 homolog n=1 Tax=Patiria miniata TaxID=46514 RepID=A0A913ZBV3_PATMI|nr:testis-expressed protein 11-like [Patiria miniata]